MTWELPGAMTLEQEGVLPAAGLVCVRAVLWPGVEAAEIRGTKARVCRLSFPATSKEVPLSARHFQSHLPPCLQEHHGTLPRGAACPANSAHPSRLTSAGAFPMRPWCHSFIHPTRH